MNRTLLTRLERLEANDPPRRAVSRDRGMVVLMGDAEGEDNGQVDALIGHGDARPDDTFIIVRRFSPGAPQCEGFMPYRLFRGDITPLPLDHLQ